MSQCTYAMSLLTRDQDLPGLRKAHVLLFESLTWSRQRHSVLRRGMAQSVELLRPKTAIQAH